jgi:phosphatidylserine decarboxylase
VGSFRESPVERINPDAWVFAGGLAAAALISALIGWGLVAWTFAGLGVFVVAFFRNPSRTLPSDERCVVAPADGWVLDVAEVETAEGQKGVRIGIFLSVFDVHVNRMPLAGKVVEIERNGSQFLAAMNPRAEFDNVRCTLTCETATGVRFQVTQITGLIARRIVCHAAIGDEIPRGARYGHIRFGSRTDVVLPLAAVPLVAKGARVHGGSTALAWMGEL